MDQELRESHATWLRQKEEEQRSATATKVSAEVEIPVVSVPQNLLAAHVDIDVPSFALQAAEPDSALRNVVSPPETVHVSAGSSPTLSISIVSDFTPTE